MRGSVRLSDIREISHGNTDSLADARSFLERFSNYESEDDSVHEYIID
jgi:hypothetical protein